MPDDAPTPTPAASPPQPPPPLPTIDVSPFLSLDTASSAAAATSASAIRAAFTAPGGAGFFYATGHGVPADVTDAVFAALNAFFSAPQAVKDAVAASRSPLHRGYVGPGDLSHSCAPGQGAGKSTGDVKESMTVGMEAPAGESGRSASPMHGPNQWPEGVPGFEPAVRAYVDAGLRAARAVARGTAAALGLKPEWFDSSLTDPVAQCVLLRYPGVPGGGVDASDGDAATPAGCGAHTDCGLITLVAQRGPPGLQVARPGGGGGGDSSHVWVTAPPMEATLVVNFGDLAAFWSGGRVASTLHRVVSPPAGGPPRDSVVLFANANFDAPVVPLVSSATHALVVGEGGCDENAAAVDAKPTTAGRYMLEKLGLMWLADGGGGEGGGS
jgi:isopenicillin N synthase-like dioxygenase